LREEIVSVNILFIEGLYLLRRPASGNTCHV